MDDETAPGTGHRAVSWTPGVGWPGVQIAGGVLLALIGVLRQDPLALLLTALAAVVLIASGVSQLLRRPRIEVVDGQLAIARIGRVQFVPRSDVVEVRALGSARWGVRQHMMRLEYLDESGGERLDVFTRLDLGADPRDVVETLSRLGFGNAL